MMRDSLRLFGLLFALISAAGCYAGPTEHEMTDPSSPAGDAVEEEIGEAEEALLGGVTPGSLGLSFPAQVGLVFPSSAGESGCSATKIAPHVVLTALHCLYDANNGQFLFNPGTTVKVLRGNFYANYHVEAWWAPNAYPIDWSPGAPGGADVAAVYFKEVVSVNGATSAKIDVRLGANNVGVAVWETGMGATSIGGQEFGTFKVVRKTIINPTTTTGQRTNAWTFALTGTSSTSATADNGASYPGDSGGGVYRRNGATTVNVLCGVNTQGIINLATGYPVETTHVRFDSNTKIWLTYLALWGATFIS